MVGVKTGLAADRAGDTPSLGERENLVEAAPELDELRA